MAFRTLKSMKDNIHRKYIDNFKPGSLYSSFLSKTQVINGKSVYDNYLLLQRSFGSETYHKEFKEFCIDFLKTTDKTLRICDIFAFEFFDLEYLKIHANEAKTFELFKQYSPNLLKKLNFESILDDVYGGFPYILDYSRIV